MVRALKVWLANEWRSNRLIDTLIHYQIPSIHRELTSSSEKQTFLFQMRLSSSIAFCGQFLIVKASYVRAEVPSRSKISRGTRHALRHHFLPHQLLLLFKLAIF